MIEVILVGSISFLDSHEHKIIEHKEEVEFYSYFKCVALTVSPKELVADWQGLYSVSKILVN